MMATPARPPKRVEREVALVTNPLHRNVDASAVRHGRTRSSAPPVVNGGVLYPSQGHAAGANGGSGGASGAGVTTLGGHAGASAPDGSHQALVSPKQKRPSFLNRVGASARNRLFTFKQVKRWRNRSRNRHLTKNSGVPLRCVCCSGGCAHTPAAVHAGSCCVARCPRRARV